MKSAGTDRSWARAAGLSGLALALVLGFAPAVHAQTRAPSAGSIEGVVSTQSGSIVLPGALVVVRDDFEMNLGELVTDGEGRFRLTDLPPGMYRVTAAIGGFVVKVASVVVVAGEIARANIDLAQESLEEKVDVVA